MTEDSLKLFPASLRANLLDSPELPLSLLIYLDIFMKQTHLSHRLKHNCVCFFGEQKQFGAGAEEGAREARKSAFRYPSGKNPSEQRPVATRAGHEKGNTPFENELTFYNCRIISSEINICLFIYLGARGSQKRERHTSKCAGRENEP